MVSNAFKTLNSPQLYLRPSNSSAHKKKRTLPESKEKPMTYYALNHIKKKGIKTLKQKVTTAFYSDVLEERRN